MKIAYLIMVHDNPTILKELIKALVDGDTHIFIHIDKKNKHLFDISEFENVTILQNTLFVYWGGFSFISAVINLIKESFKYGHFDYYVLLSGSSYPVRTNKFIKKYLSINNGKEFINLCKMPEHNKGFDRIDYYYREVDNKKITLRNIAIRVFNRIIRMLNIKRSLPHNYRHLVHYGGSTWWVLSDRCIRFIINFIDENPAFTNYYRNTLIPDEIFFHTIIGNSKFKHNIVNSLVYAFWKHRNAAHPEELTKQDVSIFKNIKIPIDYGNGYADILVKYPVFQDQILNFVM